MTQAGGHLSLAGADRLRADVGATESESEEESSRQRGGGSETVLIVEDDDLILPMACRALEKEGYRVLRARTLAEARSAFDGERAAIGLIVTDVVLPDGRAPELVKQLRSESGHLRVLYVSGYTEDDVEDAATDSPGTGFLAKPYRLSEFVSRVRSLLDQTLA